MALCLKARIQTQDPDVRPVFFPLEPIVVKLGKAPSRRVHWNLIMEQECIKLWHHKTSCWMESVILAPALEQASVPWKGEGTGIPEVGCEAWSGPDFLWRGSKTFIRLSHGSMPHPPPCIWRTIFQKFLLEGRDLVWLFRSLRILLKPWLAKKNWVAVTGEGHKTSQQADDLRCW